MGNIIKKIMVTFIAIMMTVTTLVSRTVSVDAEETNTPPGTRQSVIYEPTGDGYVAGYYYVTENNERFLVYCFNSELKWPIYGSSDNVTIEKEYVPDALPGLSDRVKELIYRVFYAGYPHNNAGLYVLGDEDWYPSEEEVNEALQIPTAVKALYPDVNWDEYSFEINSMGIAEIEFLIDLYYAADFWMNPDSYEEYDAAIRSNTKFMLMVNGLGVYNGSGIEAKDFDADLITEAYQMMALGSGLVATKDAIHDATQIAIWQVLYTEGVPNNGKDLSEEMEFNQIAKSLYEFAYSDKPVAPREDAAALSKYQEAFKSGELVVRKDGTPVSNNEIIFSEKSDGSYVSEELHLKDGIYTGEYTISLKDEDDNVIASVMNYGSDSFVLRADKKYENAKIEITSTIEMPSELYLYKRDGDSADVNEKVYQDMGGVYFRELSAEMTTDASFVDIGMTSLTVTKVWDDDNNRDNLREDVTVKLLMNGNEIDECVLSSNNRWSYTFDNLPVTNDDGEELHYSVSEISEIDGYTSDTSGDDSGRHWTIANTHEPAKTEVKIQKEWNRTDDHGNVGPAHRAIEVELYSRIAGVEKLVKSEIVDGSSSDNSGRWSYTFSDLYKYEDGEEIEYFVKEKEVPNYTSSIEKNDNDVFVITNKYTPDTFSIPVSKVWEDRDDQDGLRPLEITVTLQLNGTDYRTLKLNDANEWKGSFDNLVAADDLIYTIKEETVADYTSEIEKANGGYIITNTHVPAKVTISGTKTWNYVDSAGIEDDDKPESITVHLHADGVKIDEKTFGADARGEWTYTFPNLDKYKEGKAIVYTTHEVDIHNYTATQATGSYDILNTYNPGRKDINVTKIWDDNSNQDGLRPLAVTVRLLADGRDTGKSLVLSSVNNWTDSFQDLLEKDNDGNTIIYTVLENAGNDQFYTAEYSGNMDTGLVIKNTHVPSVRDITVTKTWDYNDLHSDHVDSTPPAEITVHLHADGELYEKVEISADPAANWSYTFEDLPVYKNGVPIVYTVHEEDVADYSQTVNGFTIHNQYDPEHRDILVTKAWSDNNDQDGKRPQDVTVQLLMNEALSGKELILNAGNNWTGEFADLLAKDSNGEEIVYTIREKEVADGYSSVVTGSMTNGYLLTNTHNPEKIDIKGHKTWNYVDSKGNEDPHKPENVVIHLHANGEKIAEKTISADESGNWAYEFLNLDKYSDGNEIVYNVHEVKIENYEPTYTGYNILNKYTPGLTSVQVTKVWNDNNDQDGKRPHNVLVRLYRDGEDTGKSLVLNPANSWSGHFADLPEYNTVTGEEIVYSVAEVMTGLNDYVGTITGDMNNGFIITNSHTPELTQIEVYKHWVDTSETGIENQGSRPQTITLHLHANGALLKEEVISANSVTADGAWTYTFRGLPKYENGERIDYTVHELAVTDYQCEVEENVMADREVITLTNTYAPDLTSVSVTKKWDDAHDQDGLRPEEVSVALYKDGVATGDTLKLNKENHWMGTFFDLVKSTNGSEHVYTVIEEAVTGYKTTYSGDMLSGFQITNSHTPSVVSVTGHKTWDDAGNQDGKRPAYITVHLKADGLTIESTEVSAENNWAFAFNGLPEYKGGNKIVYTVTEDAIEDYSTVIDGWDITNSYTPGVRTIQVTKVWDDENDHDKLRPASIDLILLADGEEADEMRLVAGDNWQGVFENLPVYRDGGIEIEYSVKEIAVDGYASSISGDVIEGFTITNYHKVDHPQKSEDYRKPVVNTSIK